MDTAAKAGAAALVTAACSATILATPVRAVESPSLRDAIVETSEASYPILKSLPKDTFPPFTSKVGELLLTIKPEKLAKSVELGIDVFLSVPPEKIATFNGVVKDAFAEQKIDSCDLVPLPPPSLVSKFTSSEAYAKVDPAKLTAFEDKWGGTLSALPKSETAICLPAVESLDKLALAQAELAGSFGKEESKKFVDAAGLQLKATVTPSKALPLLGEAQKQTMAAPLQARQRLKKAGIALEQASKVCVAQPDKTSCKI